MDYKAENVDTDKALSYIEWSRKRYEEEERLKAAEAQKYYKGIRTGLNIAEGIFQCQDFEKKEEPTYTDGVLDVVYELGKELDLPTAHLREDFSSVDDICAELASEIKNKK